MSFKDSGVEWIGEIPSHWGISKIKYQTDINKHTLNDRTPDDYIIQYIDIGNVNSEGQIQELQQYKFSDAPSRARRIVKKNDLLISTVRTYLKAITSILEDVEDNLICSTGFAVLTPKRTIDPLYLHYLSRSEIYIDEIVSRSTGVSYPAINASDIGALECILPPLNEQHLIGSFLHKKSFEVETIIQSKLKYITLLEQQRQSIITEAVTKGLNTNVKMKDSGVEWIGEIPEHWNLKRLKNAVILNPSKNEASNVKNIDVTFLPMENILAPNEVDLSINKKIEEVYSGYTYFKENDLVLAKVTPCFENGNIAVMQNLKNGIGFGTTELHVLRPKEQQNISFYYYLAQSAPFKQQGISTMYGVGGLKRIPNEFVLNYKFGQPPLAEQNEIVAFLNKKCREIQSTKQLIEKQIEKLKEYRQVLIYEAVTGKIDVRELELD